MSEALALGMSRTTLYALRDQGVIEKISRGIYRLADLPPLSNPDFVTVRLRFPEAVICLLSALEFHGLTTQVPHSVSIAVSRNAGVPTLKHPPIRVHRFSGEAFEAGVGEYNIDGVPVRIYNPEKTLADCFKFRNKLGMDVTLEALKLYAAQRNRNLDQVLRYARTCRVENVMTPYLEMVA